MKNERFHVKCFIDTNLEKKIKLQGIIKVSAKKKDKSKLVFLFFCKNYVKSTYIKKDCLYLEHCKYLLCTRFATTTSKYTKFFNSRLEQSFDLILLFPPLSKTTFINSQQIANLTIRTFLGLLNTSEFELQTVFAHRPSIKKIRNLKARFYVNSILVILEPQKVSKVPLKYACI